LASWLLPDLHPIQEHAKIVMSRAYSKYYPSSLPATLARVFGPPPLVGNEDWQLYREFFCEIADECKPEGITDWLLVRDKVQLYWERIRESKIRVEVVKIYQKEPSEDVAQTPIFIIRPSDAGL
jgi:hypothetical protein